MALRVKTVQYVASTVITALSSATLRTLTGATSIFIPEADSGTGFTWKSCTLEVTLAGDNTAAASLTSPTIGMKLGTAAADSVVLSAPIANSNENEAWHFTRDVTSYFQTNWITGTTSNLWYVNVTTTGPTVCNHCAKLLLTYQYEDSKITPHVKTIWIPIESTRGLLTTSPQTVGGATAVPAGLKTTYLPETGTNVRQVWIELWGNEATASNAAFTAEVRIGGGTWLDWWRSTATSLISARWAYGMYDLTAYTPLSATTALSLECQVLTTTSRMDNVGGLIGLTYEFDSTGSTTIYNSLRLGGIEQTGWIGGTASTDQDVWSRDIYIQEPATITIKESGIMLFTSDSGGYTMSINVSGQTTQTNTFTAGSLQCGVYSAVHRIDAGGRAGDGMTLARGKNVYTLLIRSGTANAGWNVSASLLLNYTSGKHTSGVGAHAHSCHQLVFGNTTVGAATTNVVTSAAITPTIPESFYYLVGMCLYCTYNMAATTYYGIAVQLELQSGEKKGEGWENIFDGIGRSDNENSNGVLYAASRRNYQRWVGDPDTDRVNIKTARKYRMDSVAGTYAALSYWYTYNNITYTVSGTCSGYGGDGSGIGIDFFRIDDNYDEHILSLTSIAGGTFSGTWIDNTSTIYAAGREDDTHVGRSRNGTAG